MIQLVNFGGFIYGWIKKHLPSSPYEKNEETGEVVVKEGLNNSVRRWSTCTKYKWSK